MEEIALTLRHTIVSPITSEEITESFFPLDVEDPLNIKRHIEMVEEKLKTMPLEEWLVVYVTGLSTLFQAVFTAWVVRNCNDTTMSLDMHPGRLVFAHYDRDVDTYRFSDSLTGETIEVSELASYWGGPL